MAYITAEMLEDFSGKYPSGEPFYTEEKGLTEWADGVQYYTKEDGGYVAVDKETDVFDPETAYYTAHTAEERYVNAAMETVEKYLGFSPELAERTETVRADGSGHISVSAPVQELKSVSYGAEALDTAEFECRKNHIFRYKGNQKTEFVRHAPYTVIYMGGFETVPQMIVQTALQIASLMWESAGGNLAVSSTSFADTGSRVFNNFKIDRFLEQINGYKVYGV